MAGLQQERRKIMGEGRKVPIVKEKKVKKPKNVRVAIEREKWKAREQMPEEYPNIKELVFKDIDAEISGSAGGLTVSDVNNTGNRFHVEPGATWEDIALKLKAFLCQ